MEGRITSSLSCRSQPGIVGKAERVKPANAPRMDQLVCKRGGVSRSLVRVGMTILYAFRTDGEPAEAAQPADLYFCRGPAAG